MAVAWTSFGVRWCRWWLLVSWLLTGLRRSGGGPAPGADLSCLSSLRPALQTSRLQRPFSRLAKGRSPLPHRGPSRLKVLRRNRPGRPKYCATPIIRTSSPPHVLPPYERQPVGLAVHDQLDSDTERRNGENHHRERSSHLLQGSTENLAILGREGDEPVFQAQLTGFGLDPQKAIFYSPDSCRKFVIHMKPLASCCRPIRLFRNMSFHRADEELSRPSSIRAVSSDRAVGGFLRPDCGTTLLSVIKSTARFFPVLPIGTGLPRGGSPYAFGPGLWPGPRRQARWVGRGLRGSGRGRGNPAPPR
jgi:hypothetical protein